MRTFKFYKNIKETVLSGMVIPWEIKSSYKGVYSPIVESSVLNTFVLLNCQFWVDPVLWGKILSVCLLVYSSLFQKVIVDCNKF